MEEIIQHIMEMKVEMEDILQVLLVWILLFIQPKPVVVEEPNLQEELLQPIIFQAIHLLLQEH